LTPPDVLVPAARAAAAHLVLSEDHTLFTVEWRGPYDPLIADALRDSYEAVLAYLKCEADASRSTRVI
jgi:hypothetical protein